jgi:23S rRNA (adenine2030-N6)-methyltransferase
MFAYRHAFHAGNHADVLKHLVLLSCLDYLTRKETPILYLDTHAGAGTYKLDSGFGAKNKEWLTGWQKLRDSKSGAAIGDYPIALERYLDTVQKIQAFEADNALYPGSPVLARRYLRDQDFGVLCELHPTDFELLSHVFDEDRWVQVRKENGFQTLKAVLPPPARRALVLIDPPYEMVEDYTRLPLALESGLKRFATGCYLVWYPIIERPEAKDLPDRLTQVAELTHRPWLRAEVVVRPLEPGELGLGGSGLFVLNPPYSLKEELAASLPVIQQIIASELGSWNLESNNW